MNNKNKALDWNKMPTDLKIAIGILVLLFILFVVGLIKKVFIFYGIFVGFLLIAVLAMTSMFGFVKGIIKKDENEFSSKIFTFRLLLLIISWPFSLYMCWGIYILETTGF